MVLFFRRIIFALALIDVLRVNAQFIKLIDSRPYFTVNDVIRKLQSEMTDSPFRVFPLPGALPQNGAGIYGLESVDGFHDNELRWYREFRGDQQSGNYFDRMLGFTPAGEAYLKAEQIDKGNAFLDIANVRYLLVRNGSELLPIENKNALGRVSFATKFVVMDSTRISAALRSNGYDYRNTIALLDQPSVTFPEANDSSLQNIPPLSVTWKRYTPNDRAVSVTAPANGYLRISEVYYPGWKMIVDGKASPLYRADLAWMAIPLTKGEHLVEMKPHSLNFAKAAWVTFPLAILLCLYWLTVGVKTSLKSRQSGSTAI
jgi:hypothetical protein